MPVKTVAFYWVILLVVAIGLGSARAAVGEPALGERLAHQLFTLLVCAAQAGVIVVAVRRERPSPSAALRTGALWVGMTITFELVFFGLVMGVPLGALLRDYNIAAGRVWVLVLLNVWLTPWLAARMLHGTGGPRDP